MEGGIDFDGKKEIKAITLSGDGEPTALLNFDEVIRKTIEIRNDFGLENTKIVVISNASGLHRKRVKEGLRLMDNNNGELWAKLDAGTEDYFKRVANTKVSFDRVLSNILTVSLERPIKIQTCFMNIHGEMPEPDELQAYCDRVNHILTERGQIQAVQLYTVSRPPSEDYVSALTDEQMDTVAQMLVENIAIPIEVYR